MKSLLFLSCGGRGFSLVSPSSQRGAEPSRLLLAHRTSALLTPAEPFSATEDLFYVASSGSQFDNDDGTIIVLVSAATDNDDHCALFTTELP